MNKQAAEKIAQEYYQLGQRLALSKISEAIASPLDLNKAETEEEGLRLLRAKGLTDKKIYDNLQTPGMIGGGLDNIVNIPALLRGN